MLLKILISVGTILLGGIAIFLSRQRGRQPNIAAFREPSNRYGVRCQECNDFITQGDAPFASGICLKCARV